MYGTVNKIIHKFQVRFSVHVPDDLRHEIDFDIMSAAQRENDVLQEWKDYWMQRCLMNEFPPQTHIDTKILRMPDRDVVALIEKQKVNV